LAGWLGGGLASLDPPPPQPATSTSATIASIPQKALVGRLTTPYPTLAGYAGSDTRCAVGRYFAIRAQTSRGWL